MMLRVHVRRPSRFGGRGRPFFLSIVVLVSILILWRFRALIYTTWTLIALPLDWWNDSEQFLISAAPASAGGDAFDLTFANYSVLQDNAGPPYEDHIPPVLHHISLGGGAKGSSKWSSARQSCLDAHPGWEAHMWTDENAARFVEERFPELKDMWMNYRYPIQRIDALRYMLLYEYGGAVLDMDLRCKRSLGPLRRFDFVAPAAHPIGFSNGFMMSPRQSPFLADILRNLKRYNRHWFGLPYPTVMFSTGCHFASTIHSLQRNRSNLKILAGPRDNFRLHSLNGNVSTPLFDHLGSSSWHSFDAAAIVWLGHLNKSHIGLLVFSVLCILILLTRLHGGSRFRRPRLGGWELAWRWRKSRFDGDKTMGLELIREVTENRSDDDFV